MAYYRLYFLNSRGRIARFESFEVDDDETAMSIADLRHSAHGKELWCGQRLVRQWAGKLSAPGSANRGASSVGPTASAATA